MRLWLALMMGLSLGMGAQTVVSLWPEAAPGALGTSEADKPSIMVYLPVVANATKTGVVIAPGGGYQNLAMDHEGIQVARWLNERGVAAFVLKYRLGPKYHHPVELEDAQRAIRLVRAHAAGYGMASDHLGMWGFSAGGHLTATAGTKFDAGKPGAADTIERQSSRPDFLILAYPVITMMAPEVHRGSKLNLLGEHPGAALMKSLSAERQVTPRTPPSFLFATTDDNVVPVRNSVMFYDALVKARVPVEMHLFQHGSHGVGLAPNDPVLRLWPELLIAWMRARGYAAPAL